MALEVNIAVWYFISFIIFYLAGFIYIRGGIRGLKRWPEYINYIPSDKNYFKSTIFFGALIGIGASSFLTYEIFIEILEGYVGTSLAAYLAFIASALVISATAFNFYRYWKNYIPNRPSEDMAEMDSEKVESLYDRGWRLVHQRRYSEAIECYDKAIQIAPNSARAWYYKGWAFLKQGKYLDAIPYYDKAIQRDPNYLHAWSEKGFALEKLSKLWEADEFFNKARELGILHEQRDWDNFRKEMKSRQRKKNPTK